jgi:NADPH:quinone reductase-like Zn-dependent oxidoreductase
MDLLQREGHYPVPPQASKILGVEFSGHIESLGPDVKGFKPGDEVFSLAYGGAYAQYIAVRTKMLLHKPDNFSWQQAPGVSEVWITATHAMYFMGEFKKGKSILRHAGASGVSIAGTRLAVAAGASEIYVTASSKDKIDLCVKQLDTTAGFF